MSTCLLPASQQVFILTRSFTTSLSAHTRQRTALPPPRQPRPSYQVNRLTAELDNPFQEGVRFVAPEDDAAWENIWVTNPDQQEVTEHRDRVSTISSKIQNYKRESHQVKNNPLSPYRISESDLYSLAFLGASTCYADDALNKVANAVPTPNAVLRRVLKRNGILWKNNNDADALKLMLSHRNTIRITPASELMAYFKALDPSDVLQSTMDPTEFLQWRRYISNASQGLNTLDMLLLHEPALVDAYADIYGGLDTDSEALALLNNLVINCARREKVVGKHLCFLGLSLASRIVSVPSILRYLEIGLQQGYFTCRDEEWPAEVEPTMSRDSETWKTPYATLHHALSTLLSLLNQPHKFPVKSCMSKSLLHELLGLLAGRPLLENDSQPISFRAAIGSSVQYFPAYVQYIRLLRQLGAVRLLWHEYHSKSGFHTPIYPDLGMPGGTVALKDKVFAMAVSAVPSSEKYNTIGLRGVHHLGQPDYWKDCLYEIKSLQSLQKTYGYGTNLSDGGHKLETGSGAVMDLNSASLGLETVKVVKEALEMPFEDSMSALRNVLLTISTTDLSQ